jgi:hypothetical protein
MKIGDNMLVSMKEMLIKALKKNMRATIQYKQS